MGHSEPIHVSAVVGGAKISYTLLRGEQSLRDFATANAGHDAIISHCSHLALATTRPVEQRSEGLAPEHVVIQR